jgi:hypothetical protein
MVAVATAMVLAASVVLAGPAAAKPKPTADPGNDTADKLTRAVNTLGIMRHLGALQFIADRNGHTRASGTAGHDKSAEYVAWTMRRAGYRVSTQEFEFVFCDATRSSFAQTAPTPTDYVDGEGYDLMQCSGSGDVTAAVTPVDINLTEPAAANSGCEVGDFTAPGVDVAGKIALLQRGACTFSVKALNAWRRAACACLRVWELARA